MAIERSNGEVGGRSLELAEKRIHPARASGYIQNLDDLKKVAVGVGDKRRADSAAATWRTSSSAPTCAAASPN